MTRPAVAALSGSRTGSAWHLVELLAVGVPVVLAATVAVWLISLSVLAGAVWTTAEIRAARTGREALDTPAAGRRPALPRPASHPTPAGTDDRSQRYGDPS